MRVKSGQSNRTASRRSGPAVRERSDRSSGSPVQIVPTNSVGRGPSTSISVWRSPTLATTVYRPCVPPVVSVGRARDWDTLAMAGSGLVCWCDQWRRMLGLVETDVASTGKPNPGHRTPPCFLYLRAPDALLSECCDLGLQ